jgi:uncharacterized repeat protein (TIGR03943 family)
MLLLVGATALWLGLTDAALAYVRGALRPPLVASGVALLALAAVALSGRDRRGRGHHHGAPRSGWLLALPVLVLLLVAPPALGSFAAGRQAAQTTAAGEGDRADVFPPLPEPIGGAVPLPVSEFVTRALYDKDRSLQGVRVRLLGFAAPDGRGGYLLTRFNLFCCAADGEAYQVAVHGDRTPRSADQWLVVEGRWRLQPSAEADAPSPVVPGLDADSVTPVRPPADPYEHNLYGF